MSTTRDHTEAIETIERDLAAGRLARARAGVDALLQDAGRNARSLGLAGKLAYLERDFARAESLLEEAAKLDRRASEVQHVLGNLYHDQGRSDRAISAYRRAIRARPDLSSAHNDLGTAYFAKQWYREAEEEFREAIRLDPDAVQVHQNLGEVLRRQGKLAEARRSLQRALKLRVKNGFRRLVGRGRA